MNRRTILFGLAAAFVAAILPCPTRPRPRRFKYLAAGDEFIEGCGFVSDDETVRIAVKWFNRHPHVIETGARAEYVEAESAMYIVATDEQLRALAFLGRREYPLMSLPATVGAVLLRAA